MTSESALLGLLAELYAECAKLRRQVTQLQAQLAAETQKSDPGRPGP